MDTDVELIKNMDGLLYQKAIVVVHVRKIVSLGIDFISNFQQIKELCYMYDNIKFVLLKNKVLKQIRSLY